MEELIRNFGKQMREAREIGKSAVFTAPASAIQNVVLIGLGGSAFGGEIVRNYIAGQAKVPFDIFRDYTIPAYVSENTLLLTSSYSGNTEETLASLEEAMPRNPKIVCVSSGGKVIEIAKSEGYDHVVLPGGYPPRTAAGFSIVQQLFALRHFGIIGDFSADLEEAIQMVEGFSDHNDARNLAFELKGMIPVLYSGPSFESISIRWRQQIEENGKHIAFHHVIPEMNHNELVGWKNPADLLARSMVLLVRSNLDHERVQMRMEINKEIMGQYAAGIREIYAKGSSHLAQLFYLLHYGDWVSYYLAEANQEDPSPVKVIDFLKNELAKS